MPSFTGNVENNEIILITRVGIAGKNGDGENRRPYKALLDTGAQTTLISQKVSDEVGLQAIGHELIIPVTGVPIRTKKYRIRLDIPIGVSGREIFFREKDIDVSLLPYNPSNYDVLLGMDFISELHLTICGNRFILSI